MRRFIVLTLLAGSLNFSACDSQKDPVSQGRDAVRETVTPPFDALKEAKDSLQQSEAKSKAALEEVDKELTR